MKSKLFFCFLLIAVFFETSISPLWAKTDKLSAKEVLLIDNEGSEHRWGEIFFVKWSWKNGERKAHPVDFLSGRMGKVEVSIPFKKIKRIVFAAETSSLRGYFDLPVKVYFKSGEQKDMIIEDIFYLQPGQYYQSFLGVSEIGEEIIQISDVKEILFEASN